MINTDNWNYYYNVEKDQKIRANLVYTPLVSADNKTFCMWFHRDPNYHFDLQQNELWTEELLEDRFQKELKYWAIAKQQVPTLDIIDVDHSNRKILIDWTGDDFYMQSFDEGREKVLENWEQQWADIMKTLWKNNVVKLSLHPNSWTVRNNTLIPFNWFFCYDKNSGQDNLKDLLIQISDGRLEKLYKVFESLGLDPDKTYSADALQLIALNSFRSNYDASLIDTAIKILNEKNY